MTPLRFDAATARDLIDAFRLYEGRLRGTNRRLSKGAEELRVAAEMSLRVSTDQPQAIVSAVAHDERVNTALLTLDEVGERLCVSLSTVKRLAAAHELAVVHVGRSVRVHPDALNAYIDQLKETA